MSARRAPPIPDSEPLNVVPPRQFVPTGTYLGEELRRSSARPGAYDAFALPSKFGAVRTHFQPAPRAKQ